MYQLCGWVFGEFICSAIVLICTGVVLSGATIVITDTAFVTICTDAVSYYGCLHLVWLGVSDTVVFIFTTFDFIFSLGEIILSFIVLMITIFDFIFSAGSGFSIRPGNIHEITFPLDIFIMSGFGVTEPENFPCGAAAHVGNAGILMRISESQ